MLRSLSDSLTSLAVSYCTIPYFFYLRRERGDIVFLVLNGARYLISCTCVGMGEMFSFLSSVSSPLSVSIMKINYVNVCRYSCKVSVIFVRY